MEIHQGYHPSQEGSSPNAHATIAKNANVPEHLVRAVKQHLFFTEHQLAVGPNQWVTQKFFPSDWIADLWQAAAKGERIEEFRRLLGHEYLESTLMKHLQTAVCLSASECLEV